MKSKGPPKPMSREGERSIAIGGSAIGNAFGIGSSVIVEGDMTMGDKKQYKAKNVHGIQGDGNEQTITNSFNVGEHGAELAKLLEALRTAFEAEKEGLRPEDVNRLNDCITTIEKEAKEKEPDGSVIKSMGGKLVKVIETSAKAVGLVKAGKALWDFCQQWV